MTIPLSTALLDLLARESNFDRAWHRFSSGNDQEVLSMLADIELQLELKPGFLTLDELVILKLQDICHQISPPRTKVDILRIIVCALSDIKIMDISPKKTYGDFSDYLMYRDNYNNIIHIVDCAMAEDERLKLDLDSTSSVSTSFYESNFDETASLMECDSNYIHRSPSILDYHQDYLDDKFMLHTVLEELRNRHISIYLSFLKIDSKLVHIKKQNGQDLEFLEKLMANNELIRDRMHDMRSELNELANTVRILKKEAKGEASTPETTKEKHSMTVVDSDSETARSIYSEGRSGSEILDGDSIIEIGMEKIDIIKEEEAIQNDKLIDTVMDIDRKQEHQDSRTRKEDDTSSILKGTIIESSSILVNKSTVTTAATSRNMAAAILLMALIAYWVYY